VTIVVGANSTVAALLSRCVSRIVLPDTDPTRPSTWSLATGGAGGGLAAELVALTDGLIDVPGFAVFALFDVPHAATINTIVPVTAKVASRASRGVSGVADIDISPIAGLLVHVRIPARGVSHNQH
jgi:hypothetical protein